MNGLLLVLTHFECQLGMLPFITEVSEESYTLSVTLRHELRSVRDSGCKGYSGALGYLPLPSRTAEHQLSSYACQSFRNLFAAMEGVHHYLLAGSRNSLESGLLALH